METKIAKATLPSSLYYHVSPLPLRPGSIIEPGNWGRILRLRIWNGLDVVWMREAILEVVRRHAFPEKPSRLESSFVLESIEEAQQFHMIRSNEIIYEVEIVESNPSWHRGDWNMVGPNSQHNVLPNLDRFAYAYWEAQAVTRPEIVLLSALRIKNRV